jgi:5-methylcytosine-specific restriction endonuclease McrA
MLTVPCHYCGTPGRIYWHQLYGGRPSGWVTFDHELDHVVPESKGGATMAHNLVLACRSCNRKKAAKTW